MEIVHQAAVNRLVVLQMPLFVVISNQTVADAMRVVIASQVDVKEVLRA